MRPYRKEKIASVIRNIVSEALHHKLNDPRIAPLTTVTRVEMAGDLSIARVYLSVAGAGGAERNTMRAVRHAGGFIQRMVARQLSLRQCPELRFEIDEAAKYLHATMGLLNQNKQERPELFEDEDLDDPRPKGDVAADDRGDATPSEGFGTVEP